MLAVESGVENLATNVRYQLAKKQMEGLFLKWMAIPNTSNLIQQLILDVQKTDGLSLVSIIQRENIRVRQVRFFRSRDNKLLQLLPAMPIRLNNEVLALLLALLHRLENWPRRVLKRRRLRHSSLR